MLSIEHEALVGAGLTSPVEETVSTAQVVKFPGVGNESVTTTLVAVPGPLLVTTMVKLMLSPTLNELPSGDLTIVTSLAGTKVTCSHWHKVGVALVRCNSVDTKLEVPAFHLN